MRMPPSNRHLRVTSRLRHSSNHVSDADIATPTLSKVNSNNTDEYEQPVPDTKPAEVYDVPPENIDKRGGVASFVTALKKTASPPRGGRRSPKKSIKIAAAKFNDYDDDDTENQQYTITKSTRQLNSPSNVLGEVRITPQNNKNKPSTPTSVSQRRLQQRTAIFKAGKSPKPSKVNIMLEKQKSNNNRGSGREKEMILNECHRVGSDDPIALPTASSWKSSSRKLNAPKKDMKVEDGKKTGDSVVMIKKETTEEKCLKANEVHLDVKDDRSYQVVEHPLNVNSKDEEYDEKHTTTNENSEVDRHDRKKEAVDTSPSHMDFSSRMAWAARLEKRRLPATKKEKVVVKGTTKLQSEKVKDDDTEDKPPLSDDIINTSKEEDSKGDVNNVVEDVEDEEEDAKEEAPSPSRVDFATRRAWATRLSSRKLSTSATITKVPAQQSSAKDKETSKIKCEREEVVSLAKNDEDASENNTSLQEQIEPSSTSKDDEEDKDFSVRLLAKRRQLFEKKRLDVDTNGKNNEIDKEEDTVTLTPRAFGVPKKQVGGEQKKQQQQRSLKNDVVENETDVPSSKDIVSDSKTKDDNTPQQVDSDSTLVKPKCVSNLLTPRLFQAEKRILTLEKKRQSFNGKEIGEEHVESITSQQPEQCEDNLFAAFEPQWGDFVSESDEKKVSTVPDALESTRVLENEKEVADFALNAFNSTSFGKKELNRFEYNSTDNDVQDTEENASIWSVDDNFIGDTNSDDLQAEEEGEYTNKLKSFKGSLSNEQLSTFNSIIAEYDTKFILLNEENASKTNEVEFLKGEILEQHNQIKSLLGHNHDKKDSKRKVKEHDDDEDSVSPPKESLVQTLNRKIADLHMQLDASEAAVRQLEQQKKGGKKLKRGFSSRKFSLKK